jgi:hypothetical protein
VYPSDNLMLRVVYLGFHFLHTSSCVSEVHSATLWSVRSVRAVLAGRHGVRREFQALFRFGDVHTTATWSVLTALKLC